MRSALHASVDNMARMVGIEILSWNCANETEATPRGDLALVRSPESDRVAARLDGLRTTMKARDQWKAATMNLDGIYVCTSGSSPAEPSFIYTYTYVMCMTNSYPYMSVYGIVCML
jgi:hypothetical protein